MSTPARPTPSPRRRPVMIATTLCALLLVAFSLKVFVMVSGNESGRKDYAQGEHDRAAEAFGANKTFNVFEPWVAHFNQGAASYQLKQWDQAEAEFRAALRQVPKEHECMVALDLAWTLEAQGDELEADGQVDQARARWREARRVLEGSSCGQLPDHETTTPSGGPSPSSAGSGEPSSKPSQSDQPPSEQEQKQEAEKTKDRLEEKDENADSASPSESSSSSPSSQPSQQDDKSSKQQKSEKLKEKQKAGEQERAERADRADRESRDVDKPW